MTILSFALITQWSYGLVLDGTEEFFYGFPFIHKCRGFHTSLSTQYFVMEMVLNLVCYFFFWMVVSAFIGKRRVEVPGRIVRIFWIGCGIIVPLFVYLSFEFDDVYYLTRDFDVEIYERGVSVFGSHPDRDPLLEKYILSND